jgi:N-acetylgalactosamine-6-sulfatase
MKIDGLDMSGAMSGTPQQRSKPLMWEWRYKVYGHVWNKSPMLAIRDGKWKLLMNPDGSRVELYDIPIDPGEQNNVADENPAIVADLSKQVLEWQKTLPAGPIANSAGKNDYPWPK